MPRGNAGVDRHLRSVTYESDADATSSMGDSNCHRSANGDHRLRPGAELETRGWDVLRADLCRALDGDCLRAGGRLGVLSDEVAPRLVGRLRAPWRHPRRICCRHVVTVRAGEP